MTKEFVLSMCVEGKTHIALGGEVISSARLLNYIECLEHYVDELAHIDEQSPTVEEIREDLL